MGGRYSHGKLRAGTGAGAGNLPPRPKPPVATPSARCSAVWKARRREEEGEHVPPTPPPKTRRPHSAYRQYDPVAYSSTHLWKWRRRGCRMCRGQRNRRFLAGGILCHPRILIPRARRRAGLFRPCPLVLVVLLLLHRWISGFAGLFGGERDGGDRADVPPTVSWSRNIFQGRFRGRIDGRALRRWGR